MAIKNATKFQNSTKPRFIQLSAQTDQFSKLACRPLALSGKTPTPADPRRGAGNQPAPGRWEGEASRRLAPPKPL